MNFISATINLLFIISWTLVWQIIMYRFSKKMEIKTSIRFDVLIKIVILLCFPRIQTINQKNKYKKAWFFSFNLIYLKKYIKFKINLM